MKTRKWATVTCGGKTYRMCRAKHYMLSRCFYCAFRCSATGGVETSFRRF